MQDKETVDEAEEALTSKTDVISSSATTDTKKETDYSKKESTKDGKFAFKKMKQPKKEKADKNKLDKKKYEGDGVTFKAKLIGIESVTDARGDKMCQEAMQRLKLNVKNIGPHKRKIHISVSLEGIKIKDEKTGVVMYHHPVNLISFISQDITDARAFGYVFGSTSEPHQFIAIKTEKPAFHVVLAIRDLFQTVLFHKQKEINNVKTDAEVENNTTVTEKESKVSAQNSNVQDDQKPKNENIYFEVLMTEPVPVIDGPPKNEEPATTFDDLLGLQNELNQLQEGIEQMDSSIEAAMNSEVPVLENDPFDTSFVLGPKRDSFAVPMPTPVPAAASSTSATHDFTGMSANGDKYAVFNAIDSGPSIFENPVQEAGDQVVTDLKELEDEINKKQAPPKPPRLNSKTDSTDLSVFADLDPLGKDRPYKDKTEFFQDVKNPPKKVLNDLVDPNKEASKVVDMNLLIPPVPFPVDFDSPAVNVLPSSSLPNTFPAKLSLANVNGDIPHHSFGVPDITVLPKARSESEPPNPTFNIQQYTTANPQGKFLPSYQQLNINCSTANSQINSSSSPIPIPPRNGNIELSNGNIGSPYSKSPQFYSSESPSNTDYFIQNYIDDSSPPDYRNGLQSHYMNGENGNGILSNGAFIAKNNMNCLSNTVNGNNQNGVSRPRPRPSLNKGGSVPNGGRTVSSHSLSSDSSSDYEMISRENMQSITNVLLTNGHRFRAQSLNIDSNNDFKLQTTSEKNNIFAKKNDPFADDFFFSLPKKASHLTKTEIPEYV